MTSRDQTAARRIGATRGSDKGASRLPGPRNFVTGQPKATVVVCTNPRKSFQVKLGERARAGFLQEAASNRIVFGSAHGDSFLTKLFDCRDFTRTTYKYIHRRHLNHTLWVHKVVRLGVPLRPP